MAEKVPFVVDHGAQERPQGVCGANYKTHRNPVFDQVSQPMLSQCALMWLRVATNRLLMRYAMPKCEFGGIAESQGATVVYPERLPECLRID
jgi:hypothetical protein